MADEWRALADRLAARLFHHAYCELHPAGKPEPNCPHCEDRAAYAAWEAKSRRTHRDPPYDGPKLNVLATAREDVSTP